MPAKADVETLVVRSTASRPNRRPPSKKPPPSTFSAARSTGPSSAKVLSSKPRTRAFLMLARARILDDRAACQKGVGPHVQIPRGPLPNVATVRRLTLEGTGLLDGGQETDQAPRAPLALTAPALHRLRSRRLLLPVRELAEVDAVQTPVRARVVERRHGAELDPVELDDAEVVSRAGEREDRGGVERSPGSVASSAGGAFGRRGAVGVGVGVRRGGAIGQWATLGGVEEGAVKLGPAA